jgi:hypothetical protein
MNTQTEYMNGGVTNNLLKLMAESGRKMSAEEMLTTAAHDAMPRGVFYTEDQLQAKRAEMKAKADAIMPGWENDEYLDLYGIPAESPRPSRMSAYDRKHSSRP